MTKRYIKKAIAIEALQWTSENWEEMNAFCPDAIFAGVGIYIKTLEGIMLATHGDYIIKGIRGEFYTCRKDIFEEAYEIEKELFHCPV